MLNRAGERMLGVVADQIATRFGVLGRELSHAVLQAIALTVRDGVNALDEVCRRLGIMSELDGFPDAEPPGRRWQELLGNLFPTAILVVDNMGFSSIELVDLPTTEADERTIRKLLIAAASFLLAESIALEEQVDLWEAIGDTDGDGFDEMQDILQRASSASCTLLDHAEAGSWRVLLATYAPPSTGERERAATETHLDVANGQQRVGALSCPITGMGVVTPRKVAVVAPPHLLPTKSYVKAIQKALRVAIDSRLLGDRYIEVILQSQEHLDLLVPAADLDRDPNGGQHDGLRYVVAPSRKPELDGVSTAEPRADRAAGPVDDLWSALRDVVRTHQPDCLVIAGSDLASAGPPTFRNEVDAAREAYELGTCGLLPDLRGRTVIFAGPTSEPVVSYWRAVCAAAGARSFGLPVERTDDVSSMMELQYQIMCTQSPSMTTTLVGIINDWGSTVRAVLILATVAVSAIVTIFALGHADLSGYIWIASLGVPALYLLARLAKRSFSRSRSDDRLKAAPLPSFVEKVF